MSVEPWDKIRRHAIYLDSGEPRPGAVDEGEVVVWGRDDGDGSRTEVTVSPHNGGFVRAAHVGPRGGTDTFLSGSPEKVRRVLRNQRQMLYQVEKALEILEAE